MVKRRGTEVIRLAQVATIQDGFAEINGFSVRNGNPNVGLMVMKSRDASTVTVANRVRKQVDEINKILPEGTKLEITQDGGKPNAQNLNNVIEAR